MPFGAPPRRIHGQVGGMRLWSADGTTLYFVDESRAGLYSATAPDFRPIWLGTPPVRSLHRAGASAAFQGCG